MPRYITAQASWDESLGLRVRLSIVKADNQEQARAIALACADKHFPGSDRLATTIWPIASLDKSIRPYPHNAILKDMTLREVLREWWRQKHPKVGKDGSQ